MHPDVVFAPYDGNKVVIMERFCCSYMYKENIWCFSTPKTNLEAIYFVSLKKIFFLLLISVTGIDTLQEYFKIKLI